MKIVLAGALGGIAMFIWTSLAHMALPFAEAGLREIRNERRRRSRHFLKVLIISSVSLT